ncbi:ABC transporter permease [Ruania halotolerans]|uniref:ABC transporter permease n=1 Tax=Ruania halotolerans TaxID=2897773 RepID=UPI001E3A583F|nr:ABC transporter permease subunit [Ruania halotolerans]UFU06138.1 ABC transporter permease subunit [Ruania halotolerans]
MWRFRALYVMMAPALIWFIIYRYAPMGGLLIAFKDYNFVDGIFGSPWADPWYKYFQQFFQSPYFSQLLSNTAIISVLKMFWGTVPSIFVALLFYECRILWLRKWVQTLSYMPHFMSWVIIFGISAAFLAPSTGLLNRWLGAIDIGPIAFLTSNDWFQTILVGTDAWKDLGWGAIIYFAAMMGIDQQLYEAARVDGASRLRQIWHITLPGILTVIVMLFILKLGNVLEAGFEHVYVFISPQVYPTGDIIDTWVYRTGLEDLNFALASAVGMFKSVIGLVLVLAANRLARRWGGQLW